MKLCLSKAETDRFGLRVHRASIDALDADDLLAALDRERVDVAILRLPAHAIGSLKNLREHRLMPIVADTLVRYELDFDATEPPPDDGKVTLRAANRADASLLESMTREIFSGYTSHYHANPLFAPSAILDGYAEWASSHLQDDDNAMFAWLIETDGDIVGFSCCRIDRTNGLAIGTLNGVVPGARGRGVYRGMLRDMLARFGEMGMQRFAIATQVHNVAVQRVWASEGLSLRSASNTIHINAMRGKIAGERDGDATGA
jgi:GNAT superfamily N-acetyltransferase